MAYGANDDDNSYSRDLLHGCFPVYTLTTLIPHVLSFLLLFPAVLGLIVSPRSSHPQVYHLGLQLRDSAQQTLVSRRALLVQQVRLNGYVTNCLGAEDDKQLQLLKV